MPNIKSAKKRVLISKRRNVENTSVESKMRNSIKKLEKTIKNGDKEESTTLLNTTIKSIDKAQNSNIIHQNKSARLKSRLTKAVNNIN